MLFTDELSSRLRTCGVFDSSARDDVDRQGYSPNSSPASGSGQQAIATARVSHSVGALGLYRIA